MKGARHEVRKPRQQQHGDHQEIAQPDTGALLGRKEKCRRLGIGAQFQSAGDFQPARPASISVGLEGHLEHGHQAAGAVLTAPTRRDRLPSLAARPSCPGSPTIRRPCFPRRTGDVRSRAPKAERPANKGRSVRRGRRPNAGVPSCTPRAARATCRPGCRRNTRPASAPATLELKLMLKSASFGEGSAGEQHVGRLDVAMQHAAAVGVVEAPRQSRADPTNSLGPGGGRQPMPSGRHRRPRCRPVFRDPRRRRRG